MKEHVYVEVRYCDGEVASRHSEYMRGATSRQMGTLIGITAEAAIPAPYEALASALEQVAHLMSYRNDNIDALVNAAHDYLSKAGRT